MARCPFAEVRLLPESSEQPRITPTQIISHTMAGTLAGTDSWFRRRDVNVETHFGIGRDGRIYQWMDTTVRADGNYKANRRPDGTGAISIETEGYPSEPWTREQIDALVKLHVWLMQTHTSIGRRICRTHADPGLGYHTMFGAPGPWTPVAKDCPGKKRIQQWRETVVPRVLEALDGGEVEDDMFTDDDRKWLRNLYLGAFYGGPSCGYSYGTRPDGKADNSLFRKLDGMYDGLRGDHGLAGIMKKLEELSRQVSELSQKIERLEQRQREA